MKYTEARASVKCIRAYVCSVLVTDDNKACEVGKKYMSFFMKSFNQVASMSTMNTLLAGDVLSPVRKWI